MNLKLQLYLALRDRIIDKCPRIGQHVRLFNNQFRSLEDQVQIPFPFPCVFIEFLTGIKWVQMGNGAQIANAEVTIRFHIGSNFYNGDDQEENLEIFDLQDELHAALQYYSSGTFNEMIRISEEQDKDHTSVYVWMVDYTTTLSDTSEIRPVGQIDTTGDVVPVINANLIKPNEW